MGQGSDSIPDDWDDYVSISACDLDRKINNSKQNRYKMNVKVSVGATIQCPTCMKYLTKRSYQHAFCTNKGRGNCKDQYWNTVDSTRQIRAQSFRRN